MKQNPNDIFDRNFPLDVAKSAVPAGAELMNRIAGKQSSTGPGRTGRPPKPPDSPILKRLQRNIDPDNPGMTCISMSDNDENKWLGGSIIRVVFHDETEQSFVLMNDIEAVLIDDTETSINVDENDASKWNIDSVITVVFSDDTQQSFQLKNDLNVYPWIEEGQDDQP